MSGAALEVGLSCDAVVFLLKKCPAVDVTFSPHVAVPLHLVAMALPLPFFPGVLTEVPMPLSVLGALFVCFCFAPLQV